MTGADDVPDRGAWLAAGFTLEQAREWRRWRINLKNAVAWNAAGVHDGLTATQWSVVGADADTVGEWLAAGVGSSEAVHWHELGFGLGSVVDFKRQGLTMDDAMARRYNDPMATAMQRFYKLGIRGEIVQGYLIARWVDNDAVEWARRDIPVTDARAWRMLGLTPAEAGRLVRAGRTAEDVIREWWRAGIPYDEVADWLGAGLTAEEAVAQRASGVTVDQAAALRALRAGEDPD
jgi:hypothetical protein